MSRFYVTMVVIVALLFVLGGEAIIKIIPKLKEKESLVMPLIMMVLIPLFLFQTGFLYAVSGDYTTSVVGIKSWTQAERYFSISDYWDVNGAKWLPKYANPDNITIYSDWRAAPALMSYGLIDSNRILALSNTSKTIDKGSLIYLSHFNNDAELLLEKYVLNITDVSYLLENADMVYSNGNTTIFVGLGH
jgi:uncharacterized membrane protein